MMDFISVQIFEEDDIMTPMNNADYLIRLQHADELDAMKAAKKANGLTYEALAEKIGVNHERLWDIRLRYIYGQKNTALR